MMFATMLIIAAQGAGVTQAMTPDDARRQIGFSRLCSAPGLGVFLDVRAGKNLADIALTQPGDAPLFTDGKFVTANVTTSGDQHLAIRIAGLAEGRPAFLSLTMLPSQVGSPTVSFILEREKMRPVAFSCMPAPPPVPAGKPR